MYNVQKVSTLYCMAHGAWKSVWCTYNLFKNICLVLDIKGFCLRRSAFV